MEHLEIVGLPLSFSFLNRPNIDASDSQHIIEYETAFKTGQIKNSDGMSVLCFPHPCIARFFTAASILCWENKENSSTKASF